MNNELGLDTEGSSYDKNFARAEAYMPHKYLVLSRTDKRHLLDGVDYRNGVDLFLNPIHAIFANDTKIALMIASWEREMLDPQNTVAREHELAARVCVCVLNGPVQYYDADQNTDRYAGNRSDNIPQSPHG